MKIFLTGATGYIGSAVAAELVRGRHDVTALVRSTTSAVRVENVGIHAHHGDLREPSTYVDAASAADVIVHAGVESGSDRIDVDRIFVDALRGPRLVYTSVLFVLGNTVDGDEDSPATGPRAEHERLVLDAGGAVIRPGMVWGGDDAWLFNHPLYIDDGTNRWPLVHREDVASLYRLVAESGARGVFHAVTEVLRARDVFPSIAGTPIEEARKELGGFADALALDQNVSAPRSRTLGWEPQRRYGA
jgi:nucleoside-diphosphate-sugar epimerase